MKKLTLVLSVVLMAVVLAFGASAADVFETDTNAAFDVSYTGTAGAYYAIVAVEGIVAEGEAPVITETSIQYIDQKTADADGAVLFEDILLKVDGTPVTIFLGGSDLDEAVVLGWVNKPEEPDAFTVSGTVTSASDAAATVTLTSGGNVFTVNTVAGAYSVEVPAGTYKMVVTKVAHLSYTKNELVVAENVTKDVALTGGDVDASGVIEFADLMGVLNNYSTDVADFDIDNSGVVEFSDLMTVLNNYQATAVVE